VQQYPGRLLNIHPSLLPAFTGLNTHRRVIEAGVGEHGASVHFVTEELDAGPAIIQARIPVSGADSAETLAAKIKLLEHRIYPLVIRWFAEKRIHIQGNRVIFNGKPLSGPLLYNNDNN
jgi:phosphoribosylglycinamide formyltransferase-1